MAGAPDTERDASISHHSDATSTLDSAELDSPNDDSLNVPNDEQPDSSDKKKKKKKKNKKSKKDAQKNKSEIPQSRPNVLCINRNKHWKYISSYHGPWLQLPVELLESLLLLNMDPGTLTPPESRSPPSPSYSSAPSPKHKPNSRNGLLDLSDFSPPQTPHGALSSLSVPPPFPPPIPGKPSPPPVDPGVFKCVTSIRRLIDEAAELSVRASSGMSSSELNAMRNGGGLSGLSASPWVAAQTLGLNPLGLSTGTGRNVAMSAMRIHRLRALAVSKLAQAYKQDEIASSVMVMQGGSVFDDVAERVLKTDPNDLDAKYVHFFHEKIPSRQLAESTSTKVLDELIAAQPQRLEFYRTRGVVHCFRDEYPQAIKDFTHALKESRAARKARLAHANGTTPDGRLTKSAKRKKNAHQKTNGQAPPDGTSTPSDLAFELGQGLVLHPSVLPEAPDPLDHQLLFHRGAAYLQQAVFMIENAAIELEGVHKPAPYEGVELRLCYLEQGKYGGTEFGNPYGPLGSTSGAKFKAYRNRLSEPSFKEHITTLIKKSIRDHERFIAYFDTLESPGAIPDVDLAKQVEYSLMLSESLRPSARHSTSTSIPPPPEVPAMFTTYHPLLVEAHFSILICLLMLADFATLIPTFIRTASLVDGLEGYPVFLPPRSMSHAEFNEVLERLASGWATGVQPHSLSPERSKGKYIMAAPPPSSSPSPPDSPTSSAGYSNDINGRALSNSTAPSASSSSRINGGASSSKASSTSEADIEEEDELQNLPSRPDAEEALDYVRIILCPVAQRQKDRTEKAAQEKAEAAKKAGRKKSTSNTAANGTSLSMPLSIPLHGPRVEIILAWLAAVHLPELDAVDG